jgi:hypothetical protein
LGNWLFATNAFHHRVQLEFRAVLSPFFAHRSFLSQPLLYYLLVVSRISPADTSHPSFHPSMDEHHALGIVSANQFKLADDYTELARKISGGYAK